MVTVKDYHVLEGEQGTYISLELMGGCLISTEY